MTTQTEQTLAARYYEPSVRGSFGGAKALAAASGVPERVVKKWVTFENPYSLHAPRKLKFKRNRMKVMTLHDTYQIDLCDMQELAKYNSGYRYIMTIIDCFSRFLWAVPLKNKSGPEVAAALETLFAKQAPLRIHTDKGTEF